LYEMQSVSRFSHRAFIMVDTLETIDVEKSEVPKGYSGPIQHLEAKRVQPANIADLKAYYQVFTDEIPNSTFSYQA